MLGGLAALTLFFIMLLTCIDVAGRYLFDQPVPGALEVTEFVMGALIFTSLPLVTLRQEQVTVDLFEQFIPRFVKPLLHIALNALGCICLAVISWRLLDKGRANVRQRREFIAVLKIKIWPLVYYMSFQVAVTAFVLLLIMLSQARARGIR
ncbi:MAG: TRAP transporter small permease [Rhodocyclaceae bacterium]|nr:TRAP transporter small permease [Rhodocyclaceae bacterium]